MTNIAAQASRDFFIPRIKEALAPARVPNGEMFWLVNKCNAKFNHLRRNHKVLRESFMLTSGQATHPGSVEVTTPEEFNRVSLAIHNERTNNSYILSFEVKRKESE
ncbi:MAG: hypothetical protein ACRCTP_04035 [Aeromonas popoffii]|uniref:hypothetical protein n=1 Tax=Aeromonas popoffii TaxID=70856 RepID=UPI003F3DDEC1